jgi:precorrin-6B methylase 2
MYDYFLGGYHNFEIDRRAAEQVLTIFPDTSLIMRANRAFLRRAVSFLSSQGIDQFLDVGSGIPTVGSVHEIVQRINPATRVVYVDSDPIAVIHSEAILKDVPNTAVIEADAHQTTQLLAHPAVQRLLDFSRPIAVLLVALLHFITDDDDATRIVRTFSEALPPGGYLVISHGTSENMPIEVMQAGANVYARSTNPVMARSRAQIAAFFEGFDLVEPGLVYVPLWSPEGPEDLFIDEPERSLNFVGVGRKA